MIWHIKESPTAMKDMVKTLFNPLPKEDYVRVRYEQLQMRFNPKKEAVA